MREMIIEVMEIRKRRESGWFLGRCRSVPDPRESRELDFPGEVTITGVWPDVEPGIPYRVMAEFRTDRWGRKLDLGGRRVIAERVPRLVSTDGALRYLMSIKHKIDVRLTSEEKPPMRVGAGLLKRAIECAKEHGAEVLPFIRQNPEVIADLRGWDMRKATMIARELQAHIDDERTLAELASLGAGGGFTTYHIQAIFDEFGREGPDLVRENPYRFIEQWDGDQHEGWQLEGFGWTRADTIAVRNLGMEPSSPARVMAALTEAARRQNRRGNTYGTADEVIWEVNDFSSIPFEFIRRVIPFARGIVREKGRIYFAPIHWAENAIADSLMKRLGNVRAAAPHRRDAKITEGLNLEQSAAYEMAMAGGINVLTGGPGRGKTHTCRAIIKGLRARGRRACALAPTGRAAARFTELTNEKATTIHRFLVKSGSFGSDAISDFIVDESSMIDVHLMARLIREIGTSRNVLFVGDPDQLPPVGPGKPFIELIESGVAGCVRLERVMRTDRLGLIEAASAVLEEDEEGITPRLERISCPSFVWHRYGGKDAARGIVETVRELLAKGVDADDIQTITARNGYTSRGAAVALNTRALNAELQAVMNPDGIETKATASGEKLRLGDRVMQLKNDTKMELYGSDGETVAVMNGEIGNVVATETSPTAETTHVVIDFGPIGGGMRRVVRIPARRNHLVLAYAATCHKFQGSESRIVLLAVDESAVMLADRSWIYTGITRASEQLVFWCPGDVLHRACRGGMRVECRRSSLGERLEELREESEAAKRKDR